MKKLLGIILLLGSTVTVFGQSTLKVSLADRSPINISLDGRYFNKRGQSVTVGDLPPGKHRLKIFETVENRRGRMEEHLLLDGTVKTYQGMMTIYVYDANNNTKSETTEEMGYAGNNAPANDGYNNQQQNNNYNNDNGMQGNSNPPAAQPAPAPVAVDLSNAVDGAKLDKLKKKVTAKNTDTEKMNVVKEGLQDAQLSVAQVGSIMDWFGFESTKVDFAEWAYPKTIDKQSFASVKDKLNYQSYREDIDKYLNDHR